MSENEIICALVIFNEYISSHEIKCPGYNTLYVRMKKLLSCLGLSAVIDEQIPGKSRINLVATIDKLIQYIIDNSLTDTQLTALANKLLKYHPKFKQTIIGEI